MPEIHPDIHAAIDAEFARAYAKHDGKTPRSWAIRTYAADADHAAFVILAEEVGEVARALTYDEGDPDNLLAELIQVAWMAAAWAERLMIRGDHP